MSQFGRSDSRSTNVSHSYQNIDPQYKTCEEGKIFTLLEPMYFNPSDPNNHYSET